MSVPHRQDFKCALWEDGSRSEQNRRKEIEHVTNLAALNTFDLISDTPDDQETVELVVIEDGHKGEWIILLARGGMDLMSW